MAKIKIHDGTARADEPSLCLSCRHATIVRGESRDEEIIQCGSLDSKHDRICFRVTFCSAYRNAAHTSLSAMEDVAWILRTDEKRQTIGFVAMRELKGADIPRRLAEDYDDY